MNIETNVHNPLVVVDKKPQFEKIAVVGMGYIGLPTAAMFASRKVEVIGIDVNHETVDTINRGKVHIVEPDLDILVRAAVTEGYLKATTEPQAADAFLIAVPTPFKGDNHEPDLSYIEAACAAIAPVLRKGNLVVLESTCPVGATEQMAGWLADVRADLTFPQSCGEESDIRIAHCPERVLPGKIMQELISNDRVIGGLTPKCSSLAVELYNKFVVGECIVTNSRVAEMAKLTENSYRDTNIAFANELSMICDSLDIDVWEVISLANRHPRVDILKPGPGVGGHCIAVDPWFIVSSAPNESRIIRAARDVNDTKPDWILNKVYEMVDRYLTDHPGKNKEDVTVACYGLAFKPDIDDLRESPALAIQRSMQQEFSGRLLAVEPNIEKLPDDLDRVELVKLSTAIVCSDVHVVLVGHRLFKEAGLPTDYIVKATEI